MKKRNPFSSLNPFSKTIRDDGRPLDETVEMHMAFASSIFGLSFAASIHSLNWTNGFKEESLSSVKFECSSLYFARMLAKSKSMMSPVVEVDDNLIFPFVGRGRNSFNNTRGKCRNNFEQSIRNTLESDQ